MKKNYLLILFCILNMRVISQSLTSDVLENTIKVTGKGSKMIEVDSIEVKLSLYYNYYDSYIETEEVVPEEEEPSKKDVYTSKSENNADLKTNLEKLVDELKIRSFLVQNPGNKEDKENKAYVTLNFPSTTKFSEIEAKIKDMKNKYLGYTIDMDESNRWLKSTTIKKNEEEVLKLALQDAKKNVDNFCKNLNLKVGDIVFVSEKENIYTDMMSSLGGGAWEGLMKGFGQSAQKKTIEIKKSVVIYYRIVK